MKKASFFFVLAAAFLFILSSCCQSPDLIVTDLDVVWSDTAQLVSFKVQNIGKSAADSFMVYVDLEEDPVSPDHRPQHQAQVQGLAADSTLEFASINLRYLAHPDNHLLANVKGIKVTVDPQSAISECKEDNNTAEKEVTPLTGGVGCWYETGFEAMAPPGPFAAVGLTFDSDGLEFTTRIFHLISSTMVGHVESSVASHLIDPTGTELWSFNLNVEPTIPEGVTYLSLLASYNGGLINISVNGDLKVIEDYSTLSGMVIGGVPVTVTNVGVGVQKWEFNGAIDSFFVGGGQLAMDDFCLK